MLKKKLEDAKKARDQAEQDGYDVGVVETDEALNLARVEASLALRRAKNVYYPLQSGHQAPQSPKMMQTPKIRAS